MKRKYKLMVWGPGRMGGHCIWEIANSKEFELVGVRGYLEKELGVDAGELVGIAPLGVKVTDDVEALLRTDCDCIVHTVHEDPNYGTDDEILKILAAGKNVVTVLPYQNAHLFREAEFVAKLEAACQAGGSTFYGGGIDPDLVSNRILLGLTGACADVQSILLQECWDCSGAQPGPLQFIGFGKEPEEAEKVVMAHAVASCFQKSIVYTAAKVLGVQYDRVRESHLYIPAAADIHKPFLIPAGKVGRITHRMEGFVDSIGPQPLIQHEFNWHIGDSMLPAGVQPGQNYVATIEGRPSMRMTLDFKVSNKNDDSVFNLGNLQVTPTYVATLIPCIQAIPHVVAAAPGIMPSFDPSLHWMQDLRDSVTL
ncbi:NAD(P)H-dependent amine dehydrogenase family protein [Desulfitobacterium hafniense]|uniref:Uncharacterized protein n=1 Tax=Desulfitobacterium hafniense (strain Y51) TaxID=138119 RepID=Q24QU8_DESHY|nr:hypothetical protein [Desulfitobacterium hafniense]BAE85594.1 hypothetical protein DSY3805 [Desulfitobacterium hafniense Y51]